MARYFTRPVRPKAVRRDEDDGRYASDAETKGTEVHEDGSWSEAQPTGIPDASGAMLYRCANRIGFLADN